MNGQSIAGEHVHHVAAVPRWPLQLLAHAGRPMLLAMIVLCYVAPGRLPYMPASAHGVLLLPLIIIAILVHRDRLFAGTMIPYWALLAAMALSALVAGETGSDVVRPLGFGIATAMVIYAVGRRQDIPRLFVLTAAVLVLDAALSTGLLLFPYAEWPEWLLALYSDQLDRPFHRGFYLLIGTIAFGVFFVHPGRRQWLGLYGVITLVGVVMTSLRGLWLGIAVALVALALLTVSRRALILLVVAGTLFVGVQKILVVRYEANADLAKAIGRNAAAGNQANLSSRERMRLHAASYAFDFTVKSGSAKFREELSSAGRLGYWLVGLRMFRASPWTGVGPGNFTARFPEFALGVSRRDSEITTDPHSVPVAILAELGLIGFGALVFLVGTVLRDLLRWWRDGPWGDPSVVALTAIAAGIAAAGLVWDLHLQRVTWIVLGLLQLSLERRDVPASTAVA